MNKRTRNRFIAGAFACGLVWATVAASMTGATATPAAPPPFPLGQQSFPVMAANGQLLRNSVGRVVYYTPANPAALRYLRPRTPPSVLRTTVNTGGAVANVQHPNAAQVKALNAGNAAANAAAARAARSTTGQ